MKQYGTGVFLVLIFTLAACHKREKASSSDPAGPAVKVELGKVVAMDAPTYESVVGTVRPRHEATVAADISGRILEFLAVSGQSVKKDEVIARIDASELEASLARAEASLDHATRELARQVKLLDSQVTSRAKYEQAESTERIARANLGLIKASLAKTVVKAPFSGTVTRKLADAGDLATPGRALFQIEDPASLRLEAAVAESIAGTLETGQTIAVEVAAANLTSPGKIGELEPSADHASRTFLVKIDLTASAALKSGMYGKAMIPTGKSRLLLMPASAVARRGQMEAVFVNDHGVARLRLVRTVPYRNDQCSILSGLAAGDQVVLHPPADLRDGSTLTTR
ncbi:MAG: efflux RND transporter periplasmic adaptor subunit [Akkermansiaceae bacterium]|nr:efflux RND transporter periplasmic adaptor subunit [Akkermansiaceae bacterium]